MGLLLALVAGGTTVRSADEPVGCSVEQAADCAQRSTRRALERTQVEDRG